MTNFINIRSLSACTLALSLSLLSCASFAMEGKEGEEKVKANDTSKEMVDKNTAIVKIYQPCSLKEITEDYFFKALLINPSST